MYKESIPLLTRSLRQAHYPVFLFITTNKKRVRIDFILWLNNFLFALKCSNTKLIAYYVGDFVGTWAHTHSHSATEYSLYTRDHWSHPVCTSSTKLVVIERFLTAQKKHAARTACVKERFKPQRVAPVCLELKSFEYFQERALANGQFSHKSNLRTIGIQ